MNTALISLYYQAEDYFFRGISLECLNLDDGATAYMTGDAGLNFIYINKHTSILEKTLIKGRQFYDREDLSFDVVIPQNFCDTKLVSILNSMGYTQENKSVSMVVELDRFAKDKTVNIGTRTMIKANNDRLDEWMMPLIGAFESTFDSCSIYAATHESALRNGINIFHFSLYKQENPIASITLSLNDGIARIDDVGTTPEFQGKGYATKLMLHVLYHAKILGAHHCFLEASDAGLGIYTKLGFEPLFENNIYSRKVELCAN